jgi:hypothetical protein
LLQDSVECELGMDVCKAEVFKVLTLLIGLCVCIIVVICLFSFFREDKDEQITPLCPQMVVNTPGFMFKLQLTGAPQSVAVLGADDQPINQVLIDYPAPAVGGVVAQVRLLDMHSKILATVVARDIGAGAQGLALLRGHEIFGFVEPEGNNVYQVRHRMGVHLLTLAGDFDEWDVEGANAAETKVCSFRKTGDECRGFVMEQVDSGLVIASLLAIHVHQHLQRSTMEEGGASPVTATFGAPPLEGDAPVA